MEFKQRDESDESDESDKSDNSYKYKPNIIGVSKPINKSMNTSMFTLKGSGTKKRRKLKKKHNASIKNRTLKKYNKAQIRRFNNKTKLNRTMKGGMIYTKYRYVQLKRIKEIMSELGHYKQPKLKKLLEKLEHLLINHTKTVSVTGIWQNNPEIDGLVTIVNTNLDSSIQGIPVDNTIQPSYKAQTYKDMRNENRSPKERSGTRQYSKRQSSKRQYTNTRSIISKSKGRGL